MPQFGFGVAGQRVQFGVLAHVRIDLAFKMAGCLGRKRAVFVQVFNADAGFVALPQIKVFFAQPEVCEVIGKAQPSVRAGTGWGVRRLCFRRHGAGEAASDEPLQQWRHRCQQPESGAGHSQQGRQR